LARDAPERQRAAHPRGAALAMPRVIVSRAPPPRYAGRAVTIARPAVLAMLTACAGAAQPSPPLHNVASTPAPAPEAPGRRCPPPPPARVPLSGPTVGGFAGIVIDEACDRLAGATIIVHAKVRLARTAITDEAGRFAIADLPPGRYTVSVFYLDSTLERGGVQIRAGAVEQVQLSMPPPVKAEPRITHDALFSP
jgi:hypothetical protein